MAANLEADPDAEGLRPAYSGLFWVLALLSALAVLFIYLMLGKLLLVLYGLLALGLFLFLAQGRKQRSSKQMTYLFLMMGISLSILVETIYIRDFLDNSDWERMNTVFKFFEQVWLFYSLGSALAVFEIVRWAWRARMRAHYEAGTGRMALLRGPVALLEAVFLVRGQGLLPGAIRWA